MTSEPSVLGQMGLSSGGESIPFTMQAEASHMTLDEAIAFGLSGLLLPGNRKSVEPMAARVQPGRVQAAHPSLHRVAAKSGWSDKAVLAAVRAGIVDSSASRTTAKVAVSLSAANDHANLPAARREPLPARRCSGRGQPTSSIRRDTEHQPISARQMALELPEHATLRIAAYGFQLSETGALSPSGARNPVLIEEHPLPRGCWPRGSPGQT